MDNRAIADRLTSHAHHLECEKSNLFRVRAYRRAAQTVLGLDEPVEQMVARDGRKGLRRLEGIGPHLAFTIEQLVRTGEFRTLTKSPTRTSLVGGSKQGCLLDGGGSKQGCLGAGRTMQSVRRILEMIRFSHTLFALPFALLSAVLAWHTKEQRFSWLELGAIIVCMVLARSTAMAFNRLADRHIDIGNPRTAKRHLPAGQLSVFTVWLFTFACAGGFLACTLLFFAALPPNPWPAYLAVPVLLFIWGYSFTKRFTALSHFWLGIALLLAPLSAWIAIRGLEELAMPVVLGLAVLFWVAGFDIIYACQDADFDRQAGLKSIPARVGVRGALRLALVCHLVMLGWLLAFFWVAQPHLGTIYLCGLAAVALLILLQHYLVSPENLTRVNQAFFHVNAVISIGLLLIVLLQLVVSGEW